MYAGAVRVLGCLCMSVHQHAAPLVQVPNVVGYIEEGKKVAKKQMDITLHGLWGPEAPSPLQAGLPPCTPVPALLYSAHIGYGQFHAFLPIAP